MTATDEGGLTGEARRDLDEAWEGMAHGQYVRHDEVMARYS